MPQRYERSYTRQSSGSSRRERPTAGVQGGALQRGSGGKTAVSQARERHDFERAQGLRHPPYLLFQRRAC